MKQVISDRLSALRRLMSQGGIDAAIIPQTDPHQSEYIADHWQVRRYFSGFTGSAGTLVVTADKACLWTDSRYFIQAAQQLEGTEINLMKEGLEGTPSIESWLTDTLQTGQTVGIDGMVYSSTAAESLKKQLAKHDIRIDTDFDAARAWTDRPTLPQCKAFIHDIKYAGENAADKIAAILTEAKNSMAQGVFISALDEIAWTLNLRSNDVEYNPVLTAFLFLSPTENTLLVDPAKLSDDVIRYLAGQGVRTAPYQSVKGFISGLPDNISVLVEPGRNCAAIVDALGQRAVAGTSPAAMAKACKNDTQIACARNAMARDGVALVHSFMEIERRIADSDKPLTELDVCEILRRHRSQQPLFVDESFGTIAGYGAHGAIVHYEPTAQSNAVIKTDSLLLIDSGAQYLDGTTDITRTICTGTPTAEQRRDFTLVMKGHIALASAIFPAGTTGTQIDALARQYLWQNGLTYLHGTGHGVGSFLNVHEGPHRITTGWFPAPLMPGMITSNEPGLYRENTHGIRCENLVLTVPAMTTDFGRFLKFETLTLFPFDLQLFDKTLMTQDEIDWINNYHKNVRDTLTPLLQNEDERQWLHAKTATL